MAKVFVDLSPLKESRDFRLLFIGQLISGLGDQVTVVAVGYEVYHLTHSSLQVGLVSLIQLVPLLGISLFGGSYVDAFDRRKLLLWSFLASFVVSGLLTFDAASSRPLLWPFYVLTAVEAGLSGIAKPAQSAALPQMVSATKLTAALSIRQIMYQIGAVVGPSFAGILIAAAGAKAALGFDTVSYLAGLIASAAMSALPPLGTRTKPGLSAMVDGFRHVKSTPVLQGIFLIDLSAMVFGLPRALFPALAVTHFHGGAPVLGLLYSGVGLGAFIAAVTSGWLSKIHRQGLGVVAAVIAWGTVLALFGLVHSIVIAVILLGLAGYADVVSAVLRNSILQFIAPPQMRGRLSAIQIAVVTGGPRLGDLEAGGAASLFGTTDSIVSGGVLCILGALLVARYVEGFFDLRLQKTFESPHQPPPS